jgi:hypothetical protein
LQNKHLDSESKLTEQEEQCAKCHHRSPNLSAAAELFAEGGLNDTKIEDVAAVVHTDGTGAERLGGVISAQFGGGTSISRPGGYAARPPTGAPVDEPAIPTMWA